MNGEDVVAGDLAAASALLAADAAWRQQVAADLNQDEAWRRSIAAGADQLTAAAAAAAADAVSARAKKVAAQGVADAATTRAAAVNASTPVVTLAYVTSIRAEIAELHTRDAQVASAIAELYDWRATLGGGYALVCRSVAWLGRLLQRAAT